MFNAGEQPCKQPIPLLLSCFIIITIIHALEITSCYGFAINLNRKISTVKKEWCVPPSVWGISAVGFCLFSGLFGADLFIESIADSNLTLHHYTSYNNICSKWYFNDMGSLYLFFFSRSATLLITSFPLWEKNVCRTQSTCAFLFLFRKLICVRDWGQTDPLPSEQPCVHIGHGRHPNDKQSAVLESSKDGKTGEAVWPVIYLIQFYMATVVAPWSLLLHHEAS